MAKQQDSLVKLIFVISDDTADADTPFLDRQG